MDKAKVDKMSGMLGIHSEGVGQVNVVLMLNRSADWPAVRVDECDSQTGA